MFQAAKNISILDPPSVKLSS